jgi:N-acetylneuraminic acid mutarotase
MTVRVRRMLFARRTVSVVAACALVSLAVPVSSAAGVSANKASGSWAAVGSMSVARVAQTATLLADGDVLVAGGQDSNGVILASAELYNPVTRSWKRTGSMQTARYWAAATRLADGRVLVAGGGSSSTTTTLKSAEIYDPTTGTWSLTGSMTQPRTQAASVLLQNGEVLVVGGWPNPQTPFALASAELLRSGHRRVDSDRLDGGWASSAERGRAL